jgi:hypothetical protein
MNRGYYRGIGKINSGAFLRRGRIPRRMNYNDMPHQGVVLGAYATGGASAANLTNAYSFGVSGTVAAIKYTATKNCVLTDFWFCTGANNGTPTGNLTIEVRNSTATNNLPGTLITSESYLPTQSAWNKVSFASPVSMVANTTYYIIVGDPAGNVTNYYRVWQSTGGYAATLGGVENRWWGQITTANGFATVGGLTTAGTVAVLRFADGTYRGMYHSGGGTISPSTLKRGIYVNELECDYEITGVGLGSTTSWSGVEVFDGNQGPNSTPMYRFDVTADNRNNLIAYFPQPFLMRAGKNYRVVLTWSASTSSPGAQTIPIQSIPAEWPSSLDGLNGGRAKPTIDNGNGGWSTGVLATAFHHYGMVILGNRILDPRII